MPIDTTAVDAAVAALTTEVANTESVDTSVEAFIAGFAAQIQTAVAAAVDATTKGDQTVLDAAAKAVSDVTARFTAASTTLGQAIVTTPPAPPAA